MPKGRVATKGRITIPKKLREKLNIQKGDTVEWDLKDKLLQIVIKRPQEQKTLFDN